MKSLNLKTKELKSREASVCLGKRFLALGLWEPVGFQLWKEPADYFQCGARTCTSPGGPQRLRKECVAEFLFTLSYRWPGAVGDSYRADSSARCVSCLFLPFLLRRTIGDTKQTRLCLFCTQLGDQPDMYSTLGPAVRMMKNSGFLDRKCITCPSYSVMGQKKNFF